MQSMKAAKPGLHFWTIKNSPCVFFWKRGSCVVYVPCACIVNSVGVSSRQPYCRRMLVIAACLQARRTDLDLMATRAGRLNSMKPRLYHKNTKFGHSKPSEIGERQRIVRGYCQERYCRLVATRIGDSFIGLVQGLTASIRAWPIWGLDQAYANPYTSYADARATAFGAAH